MCAGVKVRDVISDPQLLDLLGKLLEYEPEKRKKAAPLRSHNFFTRARFSRSNLDVLTALPAVLPPDDKRQLSPVLQNLPTPEVQITCPFLFQPTSTHMLYIQDMPYRQGIEAPSLAVLFHDAFAWPFRMFISLLTATLLSIIDPVTSGSGSV